MSRLALCSLLVVGTVVAVRLAQPARPSPYAWPSNGEAALAGRHGPIATVGGSHPVAIASLAKVMTALVVLRAYPLVGAGAGFSVTLTDADVIDTAARRGEGQSVVSVAAGEVLTERQALTALLLPSANNIAMVLARAVSGDAAHFVGRMNAQARRLGMTATTYTDPSGYDAGTVSTARDQVLLARAAMRLPAFAAIVALSHAWLPVAGSVWNTDSLLGTDGFVGIKTGSDRAAGGCFMFAVRRPGGRIYGVVLGQRDGPFLAAGLRAGQRLADSARAAVSGSS